MRKTSHPPKQKERPLLMQGQMVRATQEGRKTNTRGIEKAFPAGKGFVQELSDGTWEWSPDGGFDHGVIRKRCPYGQPGDRLWVRERLAEVVGGWIYVADGAPVPPTGNRPPISKSGRDYCPSIHMPRWASRITLEITKIRVERLQEISEEDAWAEGLEKCPPDFSRVLVSETDPAEGADGLAFAAGHAGKPRYVFSALWDSINNPRGYACDEDAPNRWEANPWVWCVSFNVTQGARISSGASDATAVSQMPTEEGEKKNL